MIEEKILALGIELPNAPRSVGSYVQVAITGNLVFVSGQIPVEPGSIPMQVKFKGKVGRHARSAIGASSLPFDSAVEIEFIVEI
jgi:enamine deaminase RidA (YjgF/YER057c/UK114 family)